jgi:hypothetical protein
VPVTLSVKEHAQYRWASAAEAVNTVTSRTNLAVIRQLRH